MTKNAKKLGIHGWLTLMLPMRDNRPNEWSPLPSGVIISAFIAPVGCVFLIGTALDEDSGLSPFYGLMALICAALVVWAMSDAAYIAGMRRIANQDLREGFSSDAPSKPFYNEFPTIREIKQDAKDEEDRND